MRDNTTNRSAAGIGHNSASIEPTALRQQLKERGQQPLMSKGKVPAIRGWNTDAFVAKELTEGPKGTALERIASWSRRFSDALSTGVRLGGKPDKRLGTIDIDVDDAEMIEALDGIIAEVAPDVAARAPRRGNSKNAKIARFVRMADEGAEQAFVRIGSRKYLKPGEAADSGGHGVEIFGGKPLSTGKCSRQFGVYGPHGYADDGRTVVSEYVWSENYPTLLEIDLVDLPVLTRDQAFRIVEGFEKLAQLRGWQRVVDDVDEGDGEGIDVYDIDVETTRFEVRGEPGAVGYAGLEALFDGRSEVRCMASFIPGVITDTPDRCKVYWSNRYDCVSVKDFKTGNRHHTKDKAPVDRAVFGAALRKLYEDLTAQQTTAADKEEEATWQALEIWEQCWALQGTPAELYLRDCGVKVSEEAEEVLGFHEAYPWQGRHVPALVAVVSDVIVGTDDLVGVHVTALTENRRKLGSEVLGQKQYGAILLSPFADIKSELAIAVGVENALSARSRLKIPIWALPDVAALAEFPVLPCLPVAPAFAPQLAGIEWLTIVVVGNDRSDASEAAIAQTRTRWEEHGLKVRIARSHRLVGNLDDLLRSRERS